MGLPVELFEALFYWFPHLINELNESFDIVVLYLYKSQDSSFFKVPLHSVLTLSINNNQRGSLGPLLFGFYGSRTIGNPKEVPLSSLKRVSLRVTETA